MPIRGCEWERKGSVGRRRKRREREEKGTVRERKLEVGGGWGGDIKESRTGKESRERMCGGGFSFFFTSFVMKSRSHTVLCFGSNPLSGAFLFPFIQWMEMKANVAACQELKALSRVVE